VKSGIQVLVWAGDADWICNYIGVQRVAEAVEFDGSSQFSNATLKPYTVNGTKKGEYKSVDNFSYLRVYGAGHEVPYYRKSFSPSNNLFQNLASS
jgi:carboxypeptidase C (cathepsin A)